MNTRDEYAPMDDTRKVMKEVDRKISALGITEADAARRIGMTVASLTRHLEGSYVRSDSLAKYRKWLNGVEEPGKASETAMPGPATTISLVPSTRAEPLRGPRKKPARPHRVVDLFAGCGGLSLGFDLAAGGSVFQTVLAIDIEEPMVRVFNANHPTPKSGVNIGRQADLAEFLNEAEVLAYYLDHIARLESDAELRDELDAIRPLGMRDFLQNIQDFDSWFMGALIDARAEYGYLNAYKDVPKTSLSQTSVLGFHSALKLPQPGSGIPNFVQPPLWSGRGAVGVPCDTSPMVSMPASLLAETRRDAECLWEDELQKLSARAAGRGTGQLASAARKIRDSLDFIDSSAYAGIRKAWLTWRTQRDALRRWYFENEGVLTQLRKVYRDDRTADVLLGGPPCQGFSRIGRGKIRSLREQSVHVQSDERAGDKRNKLLYQYVLFVAALSPSIFLFENVRHFQAEVKTPEGTFNATDVLAEAISNISHDDLEYSIDSRILTASKHLVPQMRERFFMVGVRTDVERRAKRSGTAAWCLSLPVHPYVPLKTALSGLPEPFYVSGVAERSGSTKDVVSVEELHVHGDGSSGAYLEWIRQPTPRDRIQQDHRRIDGHCTRDSRQDDRAFFEMLGPGKRWMDYRCDGNPLVRDLATVVGWAVAQARQDHRIGDLDITRLKEIASTLDGSLSLRLLLDRIPLPIGEVRHHLASANYLQKREGNHGDWLARLDAETPSKTMVSHMGKDTYAYIHPSAPRTISVRESARIQTFPDWYSFGCVGLVDGYRVIGNAVPPLLSSQLALRVAELFEHAGDEAAIETGSGIAPANVAMT